jgi:hypothetical protein
MVPGHMSWEPYGLSSTHPDQRDSPIGQRQ